MDNREIDKLVAEKVLGWTIDNHAGFPDIPFEPDWIRKNEVMYEVGEFSPSENMDHAWEIIDKWDREGRYFSIHKHVDGGFVVKSEIDSAPYEKVFGESYSAPMAICLAALKIAGVEV